MLNELFTNTLHDVSHRPTLSFSLKTLVAQAQLELSIQQGFFKRISELFLADRPLIIFNLKSLCCAGNNSDILCKYPWSSGDQG